MTAEVIDYTQAKKEHQIKKARESMDPVAWAAVGPLVESQINPEGLAEKILPALELEDEHI